MNFINNAAGRVDAVLETAFSNKYFSTALMTFFIVYAGMAAPNLPPMIAKLFDSMFFKILILLLILVIRNYSLPLALIVSIGFILSLEALNRYKMYGFVNSFSFPSFGSSSPNASVAQTDVVYEENVPTGVSNETGAPLDYSDESHMAKYSEADQPQDSASDPVLPPRTAMPAEMATMPEATCPHQGPQGLEAPVGYSGVQYGATYGDCASEL